MIELLNIKSGELVEHPIIYLLGRCTEKHESSVQAKTTTTTNGVVISSSSSWSISSISGHFKVFVRLKCGKNVIQLNTQATQLLITLYRRKPSGRDRIIRVLYVVCKDDTTSRADKNKIEKERKRIGFNMQLLQTYLHESIYKQFGQRKTIQLLLEDNEDDKDDCCKVFYSDLKLNDALKMTPSQIFLHLADELRATKSSYHKYVTVLSFTCFDHITNQVHGQCALGAEWLCVYGTPCLDAWAHNIGELESCFTDNTKLSVDNIDKNNTKTVSFFYDDSGFRGTMWACYATTLGSLLHELAHTLDLGHDPQGIMARGFDDLHKFFVVDVNDDRNNLCCYCCCYSNSFSGSKNSNIWIERVDTLKTSTENAEKASRRTRVKEVATFNSEALSHAKVIRFLEIDNSKSETVLNVLCTERIGEESEAKNQGVQRKNQECECWGSFQFTRANLNILFNHKWMTNSTNFENSEEEEIKETEGSVIWKINKNSVHGLSSVNEILFYELRVAKNALTLEQNTFVKNIDDEQSNLLIQLVKVTVTGITETPETIIPNSVNYNYDYELRLNCSLIKQKSNELWIEMMNDRNNDDDVKCREEDKKKNNENFEILVIDNGNNIFKKKIFFKTLTCIMMI